MKFRFPKRVLSSGFVAGFCAAACIVSAYLGYQHGFRRGFEVGDSGTIEPLIEQGDWNSSFEPLEVTVMSFNIRHGKGENGRVELERVAAVINAHSPDIVALQEVDRFTRRSGEVDQLAALSRLTDMPGVFGAARKHTGGEYGNGILSRYPLEFVETLSLPGGFAREPRSAVVARIYVPVAHDRVNEFLVLSTHFDFVPCSQAQVRSVAVLRQFLVNLPSKPMVLMGDFNASAESETIRLLERDWARIIGSHALPTYPAASPKREIDHLFCSPRQKWRVVEVFTVPERTASDHRPKVARMLLANP